MDSALNSYNIYENVSAICPCCGGASFFSLLTFSDIPLSGHYRNTAGDPVTASDLYFEGCVTCGLVRRVSHAKNEYIEKDRGTERQFPSYCEEIVDVISKHVSNKSGLIIEIGSNDGSFLNYLREKGFTNLLGIEPSNSLSIEARNKGLAIINDYFNSDIVDTIIKHNGNAEVILCRHTLEHVDEPAGFIRDIRMLLDEHGLLVLEVPDTTAIFEKMNIYEFWDEHVYYFQKFCLNNLLAKSGFNSTVFKQYPHLDTTNLLSYSSNNSIKGNHINVLDPQSMTGNQGLIMWKNFIHSVETFLDNVKRKLEKAKQPLYFIGASHPQCNYANYFSVGHLIGYMIDDDPAKVGKIPPIRDTSATIISTENFINDAKDGTVVTTGFGYKKWTKKICQEAKKKNMDVIDPKIIASE